MEKNKSDNDADGYNNNPITLVKVNSLTED